MSDSNIRANLDLQRFYEIEILVPPLNKQRSIVDIYNMYVFRMAINEKIKAKIKEICLILIKDSMRGADLMIMKCKCLTATHTPKFGALPGLWKCNFSSIDNSIPFNIDITQDGDRQIIVNFDVDVSTNILTDVHCSIEKLLMLFEGRFIPLTRLVLSDSDYISDYILEGDAQLRSSNRLSFFQSADFCQYSCFNLIDFDAVLNETMYKQWDELLDEMDIAYQLFLYNLSVPFGVSDTRLAFFVELAEPFVEILKLNTPYFVSLEPGRKGTTLKMCVDALISKYGSTIFCKEILSDYDEFLQKIIKSRNRIMHIKRNQDRKSFFVKENIRYVMKLSLLYRRILFELLGINFQSYENRLKKAISIIDHW